MAENELNSANIVIHGARQHNLKNISLNLPRDKMIVFSGLSGSGKSSLAFDTIFAEGQRRYVESLSAYARQFLGQMDKPKVDFIEGLSPAVSIDQKSTSKNPRSTVGTITEIYDYLRLLFARTGHPHCPQCGEPIAAQTPQMIVDQLMNLPAGCRFQVLAPVVRGRKGEYIDLFRSLAQDGYARVRVDGENYRLTEPPKLAKQRKHDIDVVVDRIAMKAGVKARLTDSIETALGLGKGIVTIQFVESSANRKGVKPLAVNELPSQSKSDPNQTNISETNQTGIELAAPAAGTEIKFSENLACPNGHDLAMDELEPRQFSFNSPWGACPACDGIGSNLEVEPELVVPDPSKSLADKAIAPWSNAMVASHYKKVLKALGEEAGFSIDIPWQDLSKEHQNLILYGKSDPVYVQYRNRFGRVRTFSQNYEGAVHYIKRRHQDAETDNARERWSGYMREVACRECNGNRLKPASLAVTVGGKSIAELCQMSISKLHDFISSIEFSPREQLIAKQVVKEIDDRLVFLLDVGLNYLTLSRSSGSLSGGEAQRIRLATQIGSGLVGVLYVLDEPSIGLHQRDNGRLIQTLLKLRDLGNTLIVVEHDEDTIRAADYVVDIGPGAGEHGGEIVVAGTVDEMLACNESETGAYLVGRKKIPVPQQRRIPNGHEIVVKNATENNLKDLTVSFPLGVMIAVTGVSGSGKSTLVNQILYRALAQQLYSAKAVPGKHKGINGIDNIDKVIHVDQSPIGRTPRSNPATYTGVFDKIRNLFAETAEAKVRGYRPGRFSFNVKGGRCENCQGDGTIKIEMNFLPDVYVPCEVCGGTRYNRETLEVHYKTKTISDVLNMPIEEAAEFFENISSIHRQLKTLVDVGLGYVRLGQPATTLSGGEAQRVKLATELQRRSTGRTFYVLDEPTTGLHFADISRLMEVIGKLVDAGNTMVIIEHNLDVIKCADWVIDMGPEGGDGGGQIIAQGTPETICDIPESYTGQFLAKSLYG